MDELPPLEKWLYFLRRAEQSEAAELEAQFADEIFQEAVEVLEMISRSPEDRQYYEARTKFLHDEQARLMAAREEGREQGREQGEAVGLAKSIPLLQQLLGEQETSTPELLRLSGQELSQILADLQQRLRSRGN